MIGVSVNLIPHLLAASMLAALGGIVLRANPRDRANRWFATFCFLVSANYALVLLGNVFHWMGLSPTHDYPGLKRSTLILAFMIQFLDPVALTHFAGIYPRRNWLASPWVRWSIVSVAGLLEFALLIDPSAIMLPTGRWFGPAQAFILGTYVCVFSTFFLQEFRRPASADGKLPTGFLVAWAVVVFLRFGPDIYSYLYARSHLPWALKELILIGDLSLWHLRVWSFEVGSALAVLTITFLFLLAFVPAAHRRAAARIGILSGAAMLGIIAFLVVPDLLALALVPDRPIAGVTFVEYLQHLAGASHYAARWVFFVAVVGPSVLFNQVFEIEAKLRRLLLAFLVGSTLVILLGAGVLAIQVGLQDTGGFPIKSLVLVGLIALVATQSVHVARRVANRVFPLERDRDEAYRRLRRLEVYRTAVRAVESGRAPASDLPRIRERLGLTAEEARLVDSLEREAGVPRVVAPGVVLGRRYEVLRLLGKGGHGRVFLAKDRRDARHVAVKELTSGAAEEWRSTRIENEILSGARLRHPNIVPVLDYFVDGSTVFLVTAYVPGGSLSDRLRTQGAPSLEETVRLATDVLRALEAAHAAGVVHRDVKPANVLFGADGRAALTDFGIALVSTRGEATLSMLLDPSVPGTPGYVPPEAFRGATPDARWDIYAAGTLLLELLIGRAPERRERSPPGTPHAVAAVIDRARATEPHHRFSSAREMREALEDAELAA